MGTTYVYTMGGQPHGYTTDDKNWYLAANNQWWAYQVDNYLYDAKTNRAVAYWSDDVLYSADTNEPLWYRP